MSNEPTIHALLEKLQNGAATADECRQLRQLITEDEEGHLAAAANTYLTGRADVTSGEGTPSPYWEQAIQQILQVDKVTPARPVRLLRRYWVAAAAVLLLALAGGALLWQPHRAVKTIAEAPVKDIAPGKAGAILTLSDGSRITLDSLGNGVVANQQGARTVIRNGQLVYDPTGDASGAAAYNIMTTPRGRQFSLLLPDGTRVWLNAASAIRFPVVFRGGERKVEITGEAYFEVAQNAAQPFHVQVNNRMEIEVLGTSFNVHAYKDEPNISTTLLQGRVKVGGVTLKPGQQAQMAVTGASAIQVTPNADTDKVIAWKNGLFNFNGATLQEVMKQLERWYDIDVVYEKGIPDIKFGGKMTKGVSLQGVLIALEKSEVHFKLEGRKLIILP